MAQSYKIKFCRNEARKKKETAIVSRKKTKLRELIASVN